MQRGDFGVGVVVLAAQRERLDGQYPQVSAARMIVPQRRDGTFTLARRLGFIGVIQVLMRVVVMARLLAACGGRVNTPKGARLDRGCRPLHRSAVGQGDRGGKEMPRDVGQGKQAARHLHALVVVVAATIQLFG